MNLKLYINAQAKRSTIRSCQIFYQHATLMTSKCQTVAVAVQLITKLRLCCKLTLTSSNCTKIIMHLALTILKVPALSLTTRIGNNQLLLATYIQLGIVGHAAQMRKSIYVMASSIYWSGMLSHHKNSFPCIKSRNNPLSYMHIYYLEPQLVYDVALI